MIWRVSISVVLFVLYSDSGRAQTSDLSLPEHTGLSLFMTLEDQKKLEQRLLEQKSLEQNHAGSITRQHDVTVQHPEGVISHNRNVASDSIAATVKPIRYDGVILKQGQMVDVWLDGKRVLNTDDYAEADFTTVDSAGQLHLTIGEHSVRLFPGDSHPFYDTETKTRETSFEIQSNESDTSDIGYDSDSMFTGSEGKSGVVK